ncbi:MAG: bifunctional diaminohydroxyphosphoribosylaminopyrimidine deaminase/5-amino-6-(5-phosphoribosylamino)uracil reductase RibD [Myxococcales bacterium]|nr:bifunctional diaminohydroxyphosphoribosylaminopyrimidine deaminase/5-amino-6-(5-phosphoribosylamino)uracil reductase RibD [Myxococcales bacterium]
MKVRDDIEAMRLALDLAARGRPSPNPHVGAVVVRDGEIVGRGHHERAGMDHAEVAAIKDAGPLAKGATVVVTLEPCNHHGRTGPCTEALIEAGVARVVIGAADPRPHVPGACEKLRAAGIEVVTGVLEDEAERLIRDFAKHRRTGRPFVTVKAALSLDGRMATGSGDSKWITGETARAEAHRLRAESDGVLVGIGTVLADDPELTCRLVPGTSPKRFVLDTHLRMPFESKLVQTAFDVPLVVLHGPSVDVEKVHALVEKNVRLVEVPVAEDGRLDLEAALVAIGRLDVVRLLVEGGASLHAALLAAREVDRVAAFVAPCLLGGSTTHAFGRSIQAASMQEALRLEAVEARPVGADVLVLGDVPRAWRRA